MQKYDNLVYSWINKLFDNACLTRNGTIAKNSEFEISFCCMFFILTWSWSILLHKLLKTSIYSGIAPPKFNNPITFHRKVMNHVVDWYPFPVTESGSRARHVPSGNSKHVGVVMFTLLKVRMNSVILDCT